MGGALGALRQEVLRHRAALFHGYSKRLCICRHAVSLLLPNGRCLRVRLPGNKDKTDRTIAGNLTHMHRSKDI